jgi:heterodisulfide reductase subunit C2
MAVNKGLTVADDTALSRRKIELLSGEKISACYQCQKCTNGCPLTFAMDIAPHLVLHSLQLGLTSEVIDSDTIWVCASCETCTTRCPNEIDIAHVMDVLRQLSTKRGVKAAHKQAPIFHKTFLNSIKTLGRIHETSMILDFTLRAGGIKGLLKQSSLGLAMLRRGKMKIFPERFSAGQEIKTIFRKTEDE